MRPRLFFAIACLAVACLSAEAFAIGRAGGRLGGAAGGAARGGNIGAGNIGGGRGGNIGAGNVGGRGGSISRPSAPSRPNVNRPNTSIPSLGGGSPINRPPINRPDVNRPSINRPGGTVTRPNPLPDRGNIGANRPGVGGSRPNLPNIIENRPPGRPDLGNRPGNRPGVPDPGSRPGGGIVNLPDRPNIADRSRPDRVDRPSRDRVNDFLEIQRPGVNRPDLGNRPGIIDRPSRGDRPGSVDRPNLGQRPDWGGRPDRPIIGGGDRNINIHNRPPWVNVDNSRHVSVNVRNRWNSAITARPGDIHDWRRRRPDRVARWRHWGNSIRFRWGHAGWGIFGPAWWARHQPSFCAWHHWRHWQRHSWNFWWTVPTFRGVTNWFTWSGPTVIWAEPIFFDYGPGGNVVFQDNRVIVNGEDIGSVEEFSESAAELAAVAPPADETAADAAEWLPLGTFAVSTSEEEGEPTRFIQLAVSREGIISGTYYNSQTDVSQVVLGQVDSETQRVAMRLGEDENIVAETGIYNLTLDEAPVLVHFGPEEFEFFLLVRIDSPEEDEG